MVKTSEQVTDIVNNMNVHEWVTALDLEMEFVSHFMKAEPWLDIVKEAVNARKVVQP
jgi:hypothetical protein